MNNRSEYSSANRSLYPCYVRSRFGILSAKILLLSGAIAFLVELLVLTRFFDPEKVLGLSMAGFGKNLALWQLLTYPFYFGSSFASFIVFCFCSVLLIALGGDVETVLGPIKLLILYASVAVGVGFFHLLTVLAGLIPENAALVGPLGPTFGLLSVYWLLFRGGRFLEAFKVRHLSLVLIVIICLFCYLFHEPQRGISYLGHVSGFVIGIACLQAELRLRRYYLLWNARRLFRKMEEETRIKKKVDGLLQKISREGMGSLTKKERKFLLQASRFYRKQRTT